MNKITLIRSIAHSSLSSHAKNVGVVIALSFIESKGFARLKKCTISDRTGLKGGTLDRSISELSKSGILERTRTGRASIWRVVTKGSNYSGNTTGDVSGAPRKVLGIDDSEDELEDALDRGREKAKQTGDW